MTHTPGPYHWHKHGQSEKDIADLRRVGLEPTLMLTNEGQVALFTGGGDDRKRIALIDCQTPFKRGKGYLTECAERDANANLFAASDDLFAAAGLALQSNMLGTNEPSVTISRAAYDALKAAHAKTIGGPS